MALEEVAECDRCERVERVITAAEEGWICMKTWLVEGPPSSESEYMVLCVECKREFEKFIEPSPTIKISDAIRGAKEELED